MTWFSHKTASSSDASAARDQQAPRGVLWKVRRAQAVLVINRAWPLLWLPLGVAGVFLLLSLFGAWALLPAQLHQVALWGFGAAQLLAFVPLLRLKLPTAMEALRHMELAAGLPHRPATAYHDQLAGSETASPTTNRLWAIHRERAAQAFAQLKAGWPAPRADQFDPFALRAALLLLLAVAFVAHRDDAGSRIKAAFLPSAVASGGAARLDAWITPPLYTGKPPIMLADGSRPDGLNADGTSDKRFLAPINSVLTVRVNQADASRYSLRLIPMVGETKSVAPAPGTGKESFSDFKETLLGSGDIELQDAGVTVARWTVDLMVDTAPKITLSEAPAEAQRGSLRFRYKVEDDYGVVSAQALIDRAQTTSSTDASEGDEAEPLLSHRLGTPPVMPLTLPRANAKSGEAQTFRDLTPHFWAGLPVTVTLEARDQTGQVGRSAPQTFVLPERKFNNQLARAIIEQRKKLVARPDRKEKVAAALDALTIAPDKFIPDKKVYLGLRAAHWRIQRATSDEELETAAELLWNTALRVEEGDLPDAEKQLRAAQDALMRALEENAPEHEVKRLMAELRSALDRYIESARKQARNEQFDPKHEFGNQRVVTPKDLEQMLKEIEDLARTGSKDAARKMLSELRDLLENSRTGRQAGNSQNREAMAMLDGLSEIIKKQQKLLDETYRKQTAESPFGEDGESIPGAEYGDPSEEIPAIPGEDGAGAGVGKGSGAGKDGDKDKRSAKKSDKYDGLRDQQSDLHKELHGLTDKLRGMGATPPENLDGAGTAMNEAAKALGESEADRAIRQQTLALDKLRSGTKALAEQMMKNSGGSQRGGTASNEGRDPLGRPMRNRGELDSGDSVKVPGKGELDLQRAREILDELRHRLGDRARPAPELEYIERLIERF